MKLHTSHVTHNKKRVPVTLIPGDGVGPEIMDSCQEVLQSMGARLDFETIYFSEVVFIFAVSIISN